MQRAKSKIYKRDLINLAISLINSIRAIFLSKSVGYLLFFLLLLLIYHAWPTLIFRIANLPFENYLYFLIILFLVLNLTKDSINIYLFFFFFLVILLTLHGYINNSHHIYYSIEILLKDLRELIGLPIGYIVGRKYKVEFLISRLFDAYFIVGVIILISFPMYDYGFITTFNTQRKFLPNQFFAISLMTTFLPIFVVYFQRKSKLKTIICCMLYLLIFVYAFRSATRSMFIWIVLSLFFSCYFTRNLSKLFALLLLIIPFVIPFMYTSLLFERLVGTTDPNHINHREVEAMIAINDFMKNGNYWFGHGLGVGTLNPFSYLEEIGINVSPHISIITPLYKGGIVFFSFYIYPFFYYIIKFFLAADNLYKVIICALVTVYLQACVSGGYSIVGFLLLGLLVSMLDHYNRNVPVLSSH